MSGANFTMEGTENLKRIFAELPEKGFRAPVNAAFRKAARPVQSAIVSNLPAALSGLKKAVRIKSYKSAEPSLAVGVFKKGMVYENSRGQQWNPYMLLYWQNYGTLANRMSGHSFKNPRRSVSASWKGGIKPGEFVEKGVNQGLPEAQKIFEVEFDKEITKFFEKYAAK